MFITVFRECTVELGGETYSVPHGEYFIDVASCMRCLCENGEATLCEPSTCRALSSVATGCEYNGQSYSHGETFDVRHLFRTEGCSAIAIQFYACDH